MGQAVAEAIKQLFEADPPIERISYRDAWAYTARELGRPIRLEEYDAGVISLVREGFLAGRGAASRTPLVRKRDGRSLILEAALMPGVGEWLREVWLAQAVAGPSTEIIDRALVDTSRSLVRRAGANAHPDFLVLLTCEKQIRMRTRYLDVTSFELKAANAQISSAAQEAENHHKYVNRSYLVWHIDGVSATESDIERLRRECDIQGIGLIVFSQSDDPHTFRLVLDSVRREPDAALVEEFVEKRVPPSIFNRMIGGGERDGG